MNVIVTLEINLGPRGFIVAQRELDLPNGVVVDGTRLRLSLTENDIFFTEVCVDYVDTIEQVICVSPPLTKFYEKMGLATPPEELRSAMEAQGWEMMNEEKPADYSLGGVALWGALGLLSVALLALLVATIQITHLIS